jgi:hypothetical protein
MTDGYPASYVPLLFDSIMMLHANKHLIAVPYMPFCREEGYHIVAILRKILMGTPLLFCRIGYGSFLRTL